LHYDIIFTHIAKNAENWPFDFLHFLFTKLHDIQDDQEIRARFSNKKKYEASKQIL
jgi:hypothetical protein